MVGDLSLFWNIYILIHVTVFIFTFFLNYVYYWTIALSITFVIVSGYNAYVLFKNKSLIAANFIFSSSLGEYFNEFTDITANAYEREGLVATHWEKISQIPEIAENMKMSYTSIKFTIMFYNNHFLRRARLYALINIFLFIVVNLLILIVIFYRLSL
jgi:hypothetical protein